MNYIPILPDESVTVEMIAYVLKRTTFIFRAK
jgi:translation initiation factor IF-1